MSPSENHEVQNGLCKICGKTKSLKLLMPSELIRNGVHAVIKREHPDWDETGYVCFDDLNHFRTLYMEAALKKERGEISALGRSVVKSLKEHEIVTQDVNTVFERQLTFGEKLADKVAEFGGSWRFIISFGAILVFWIILNVIFISQKPFDPYPFILLNLVLSCLAALQAPIIMMSQNRQEDKDRMRAESDYRINLKAELEIRHLNEKIDHLLNKQWQRLLEIQQIQLDMMEEVASKKIKTLQNQSSQNNVSDLKSPAHGVKIDT